VTYVSNFGTPSISLERLELETSNLASRLITKRTNERTAKVKEGRKGSRDLVLKFRDHLHISGKVKAGNFKFGMHIKHKRP